MCIYLWQIVFYVNFAVSFIDIHTIFHAVKNANATTETIVRWQLRMHKQSTCRRSQTKKKRLKWFDDGVCVCVCVRCRMLSCKGRAWTEIMDEQTNQHFHLIWAKIPHEIDEQIIQMWLK